MIRVLSVQHYPTFGGPYNEILLLDRPMRQRGVETIVVMTDEPGTARARLTQAAEVRTMPLGRIRNSMDPRVHLRTAATFSRDIRGLRASIRRERADLVKVHGPHNPHGAMAARLEGVPVVWVISSTRVPASFRRLGVRMVRRHAASVLVCGHGLLEAYPGAGCLRRRSFAYYPPVDTDAFHPASRAERATVREDLGVPRDAPLIGTIANVNPQKGISTFLRVASSITDSIPAARFVVVGAIAPSQRAYYNRIRAEAFALGLGSDRLAWLGDRSDVSRLVAAFDVKVITSVPQSEGTTTTAGEAMACCVPVVATDVGAVSEIVDHGTTGFVVSPDTPDSMADRILDLLRDEPMRRRMGVAARERVIARFGVEECADVHLAAYRLALGRSEPGRATIG